MSGFPVLTPQEPSHSTASRGCWRGTHFPVWLRCHGQSPTAGSEGASVRLHMAASALSQYLKRATLHTWAGLSPPYLKHCPSLKPKEKWKQLLANLHGFSSTTHLPGPSSQAALRTVPRHGLGSRPPVFKEGPSCSSRVQFLTSLDTQLFLHLFLLVLLSPSASLRSLGLF